jgi:hypothetical protein
VHQPRHEPETVERDFRNPTDTIGAADGQAGDRHRVASPGVSALFEMEKSAWRWPPGGFSGSSQSHRTAYQDFLTLWKEADADIPVLKQANGGYAKLK